MNNECVSIGCYKDHKHTERVQKAFENRKLFLYIYIKIHSTNKGFEESTYTQP